MKLRIITIHHIHNFGSVFQAYALQRFLNIHGYDVKIVDYRPAYYEAGRSLLRSAAGRLLNVKPYLTRKKKFEGFIAKNLSLTEKTFKTISELQKHYERKTDCVLIAGGDQLWNSYHPCGNDDAYKLSFASHKRKMAYGTSLGRNNYTDEEWDRLAVQTADFHRIMIRENCTVRSLSNRTEVPVDHVIDPVGLIEKEEFLRIAVKPDINEPYAVMYLADSGALLDQAIDKLRELLGLKIVHICGFRKKCYCDYFEKDLGPEEVLGYILHADFVLSASFHATMFSVLFEKQFATLLPNVNTNVRIEDVLSFLGLQGRIIYENQDLVCLEKKIDYTPVRQKIFQFAEDSRKLLLTALKDMEN